MSKIIESKNGLPTVNFIDDKPVITDLFGSKAHERTAQAIIELVTNKEVSSKTIALTGSWGSGKSTVVELLKNKLDNFQDYEIFVFNAWSHDKDPIRTAFLDELIKFLLKQRWLKDERKWTEVIDELSGRLKKSRKLEPFGYKLLLSGFVISLGIKLVSLEKISLHKWSDIGIFPPDSYTLINLWLPLLLIGFPIVWLALSHENTTFYSDQSSDRSVKQYESISATSIDFQKAFKDILTDVIHAGFQRKLLIVIDNLDRLEPEVVKDYWSLVNTFFDITGNVFKNPETKYREVFWLLVPYDPEGLRKKFQNKQSVFEEGKEDAGFFESFTEKTFQITYKVPFPVNNDWKEYMMNMLLKERIP